MSDQVYLLISENYNDFVLFNFRDLKTSTTAC